MELSFALLFPKCLLIPLGCQYRMGNAWNIYQLSHYSNYLQLGRPEMQQVYILNLQN